MLEPTPPGDCRCGCGLPAPIAKVTDRSTGRVKGQPMRFVSGHNGRRRPLAERLWAKVDRSGGPEACWPWTGAKDKHGYGSIRVGGVGSRSVLAHRLAWELTRGPIPPETPEIRHVVCRNPPCCNPTHLKPGTHADNGHDMVLDGTSTRGERCAQAKLTEAQVREIRWLGADIDLSQRAIAGRFGVTQWTIGHILAGHTWAHVKVEHVAA